jgi:hypothetical protein
MSRLAGLVLGAFAAMLLAALVPMVLQRSAEHALVDAVRLQAAESDVLTIMQPVVLSQWPQVVLERGVLRVDRARASRSDQRLVLEQGHLLIAVDPRAGAPEPARTSEIDLVKPLTDVLAALGFEQLTIRRGELRVRWPGADGADREVLVSNVEADLSTRKKGALSVQGDVTVGGERVVFEASIAAAATGADRMVKARRPLFVSFRSARAEGEFDGRVEWADTARLTGQLDVTAPSAFSLADWLGVDVGADRPFLRNVAIKGQLTAGDGVAALDKAQIAFDGQPPGNGTMSWRIRAGRPQLEATLAFGRIDLQPYLASAPPRAASDGWSRWPLTVEAARRLDADVRVSSTEVFLADRRLGRGAATLGFAAGRVAIDVAELQLGDDRLRAHMATEPLGAGKPRHTVRATLDAANIATWLGPLGPTPLVSGPASVQFDLRSQGDAVWQALSEATGRISIAASCPCRTTLDLRALRGRAELAKAAATDPARAAASLWSQAPVAAEAFDLKLSLQPGQVVIDQAALRQGALASMVRGRWSLESGEVDLIAVQRTARPDETVRPSDRRPPVSSSTTYSVRGGWREPSVVELDRAGPLP